jgi:DNA invertase Pin-like site-specific DNA recombinase
MSQAGAVKVGLYARVSTSEQTTENQILALRAHAQQRGWQVAEEFVDDGVSGAKESRPALDRLMKAAWAGKFQTVLVWRFDRFARSTKHLVTALDTFRSLGVAFISLTEQVDTSTPLGQAMFTIISAMAQLERDVIRERVKLGLARAKASGVRLGPPMVAVDLPRARALLAEGRSLRTVAKTMGIAMETLRRHVSAANHAMAGAAPSRRAVDTLPRGR